MLIAFIIVLVAETKPGALHMPGKHSVTELYLQSGLHIMDLLHQSGQLRCGEQDKVEGVKNSYQNSATVKPSSHDAAVRSEGIVRKRMGLDNCSGRTLPLNVCNEEKSELPQVCSSVIQESFHQSRRGN